MSTAYATTCHPSPMPQLSGSKNYVFTTIEHIAEPQVARCGRNSQQRGWRLRSNCNVVNGSCPKGQVKNNKQLTTASTFYFVEAVALFSHTPDHSGGYFNIIINECNLTPLFDTSSSCLRTEERRIQRGYFFLEAWLLCTKHSDTLKCKR